MSQQNPDRWRELAEQAEKERPKKLMELSERIKEILDENYDLHRNGKRKARVRLGGITRAL